LAGTCRPGFDTMTKAASYADERGAMSSLDLKVAADPWALSFGILEQASPAGFLGEPRWHGGAVRVGPADPPAPDWYVGTTVRTAERGPSPYAAVLDTHHPPRTTAPP